MEGSDGEERGGSKEGSGWGGCGRRMGRKGRADGGREETDREVGRMGGRERAISLFKKTLQRTEGRYIACLLCM